MSTPTTSRTKGFVSVSHWSISGVISVGVALVLACDHPSQRGPADDTGSPSGSAPTGEVLVSGDFLGLPGEMRIVGSRLVILDGSGDPHVHIIDAETGDLVRSLGTTGEGPGDFQRARGILSVPGETAYAWIFDFGLKRITEISLADVPQTRDERAWRIINFSGSGEMGRVHTPAWMDAAGLIAYGGFPGGSLVNIDQDGRPGQPFGPPTPGGDTIPYTARLSAYQGQAVFQSSRKLIARSYRNAGRIDIWDFNGREVATADVPDPFEPIFVYSTRRNEYRFVQTAAGNRRGYLDIEATEDFIFALFSGLADTSGEFASWGSTVHIFDWSGDYVGSFGLGEERAVDIAVDVEARTLWTSRFLPEPQVRVYSLEGALPKPEG